MKNRTIAAKILKRILMHVSLLSCLTSIMSLSFDVLIEMSQICTTLRNKRYDLEQKFETASQQQVDIRALCT